MRTLIFMIQAIVFIIGMLISPQTFVSEQEAGTAVNSDIIVRATATEAPAGTLSIAAAATSTPAPEPTATDAPVRNPEDIFGSPQIMDNFDRGSSGFGINAGLNDDDAIRIIALNNRLSLEPKKSNGWLSWRLRPPVIQDGAAEAQISLITCARGDRAGLILHAPDYSNGHGYYISLACEGIISILRDSETIGSADVRPYFKNNSGDVNTLAAVIQGDRITAILNGEAVLTAQDSTYPEGYSGFFTAPQNEGSLTLDILGFNSYFNVQ